MKEFPVLMARLLLALAFFIFTNPALAQGNSWIGSGSGDWESPQWSLGLPAAGEDIFITNAGDATIVIEPTTVADYPQTLNITSLTISPPDGFTNELLMNLSGLETPLTIGYIYFASNAICTLRGSSLVVNDSERYTTGWGYVFTDDGTFNLSENSSVICGSIFVGTNGQGVLNLTNSALQVAGDEIVGGTVNQDGGTNSVGLLEIDGAGNYNLYSGKLLATNAWLDENIPGGIITEGGSFNQYGGFVSAALDLFNGSYYLVDGILNNANLYIPGNAGSPGVPGWAGFTQSGGTNYVSQLILGGFGQLGFSGIGGYTLNGGTLLITNNLLVGYWAFMYDGGGMEFTQTGGYHTNSGISILGVNLPEKETIQTRNAYSDYNLSGGILETGSIYTQIGSFNQSGGTNIVGTFNGSYTLNGGVLIGRMWEEATCINITRCFGYPSLIKAEE